MTTEKEQEAFGLVLERQKNGASENDIRTAFQRFLETASVAAASEMTTEVPPGQGNPGRMDLLRSQHVYRVQNEYRPERATSSRQHSPTGRIPRKPAQSRGRRTQRNPH